MHAGAAPHLEEASGKLGCGERDQHLGPEAAPLCVALLHMPPCMHAVRAFTLRSYRPVSPPPVVQIESGSSAAADKPRTALQGMAPIRSDDIHTALSDRLQAATPCCLQSPPCPAHTATTTGSNADVLRLVCVEPQVQ